MEDLIPVVNKLQDVFSAIGQQTLDLPQIVVVGSQSSGKSSVLESIVGRDFLPRGSGIVTRRPLVLQLYCIKNDENFEGNETTDEEWGEFLHLPNKKFYDFQEIRAEIQKETDRITGRNKGISNQSINLKIFSPYVLNLTLVDLPGVTKVPTGDQPSDIEKQIREMSLEFISNPNAVILAVSAANQDLSNSDGLQLALTVDPGGERTIGVLTKVDLMDHGTDASEILLNRVHPLRRGYVAVVNRSQKDINENMSVRDGISKEIIYFQTHPRYRSMLSKCGTGTLTNKLNQILMQHIRECLPGIKSQISNMLSDVVRTLESLGESIDDLTPAKQGEKLLKIISKFSTRFNDFVDGKGSEFGVEIEELCGGARILFLFNEVFAKRLISVNPFDTLRDQDIQTAMTNSNGIRHPLFIPESSFDLLVRKLIVQLEQPGVQCVDLVYDEMIRMCLQIDASELGRYPVLRDRVFEVIHQLLRDCVRPTQLMISNIIQSELAYINTSHPDFIGGKKAILAQQQIQQQQQQIQQQNAQVTTATQSLNQQQQQQTVQPNQAQVPQQNQQSVQKPTDDVTSSANTENKANSPPQTAPRSNQSYYGESIIGGSLLTNIFRGFPAVQQPTKVENNNVNNVNFDLDTSVSEGTTNRNNVIRLKQVPDKMKSERSYGSERIDVQVIKLLIASYFDIVKKSFTDFVPKIIMNFLVIKFKESLQNELISKLYKESLFPELLKETDDGAAKRLACKEMRDLLLQAMEIVNEVRDYNVFDR